MYVPVGVSVLGVHVEQFVDQGVVVCLEAWCGVPLALLLEVSEVGVFPGVCGFWWGFCKKLDQLVVRRLTSLPCPASELCGVPVVSSGWLRCCG